MCWAKIGQFDIYGRRPSIKHPGRAADGSCRVSEKSPDESTRRTASPLATITARTPTKLIRRRWSRAAHSTSLTTSRLWRENRCCEANLREGGKEWSGTGRRWLQGFHGPTWPLGLPSFTCAALHIETQEGKPGWRRHAAFSVQFRWKTGRNDVISLSHPETPRSMSNYDLTRNNLDNLIGVTDKLRSLVTELKSELQTELIRLRL